MRCSKRLPTIEEWAERHTFWVDDEMYITDMLEDGTIFTIRFGELMASLSYEERREIYRNTFLHDPTLAEKLLNAPHWTDEERQDIRKMIYDAQSGAIQ